jgi:hypothetical protein
MKIEYSIEYQNSVLLKPNTKLWITQPSARSKGEFKSNCPKQPNMKREQLFAELTFTRIKYRYNTVTFRMVSMTKITGSSSDDWIY